MRTRVLGLGRDDGYVVAEAAFVIPAIIAVAVTAVGLMSIALTSLGLHAAAHSAAREIARGTPAHSVYATLSASHPQTAVTVTPSPQGVTVTVNRDLQVAGGILGGFAIPLSHRVVVPWEWGVDGASR